MGELDAQESSNQELFDAIFPNQVAVGQKRPNSWTWITSRIRDANGIKPPRNLIDLIRKSQEAQLRREEREERIFESGKPLFEPESIKRAHIALSEERVEDTLLAEAGEYASYIEKFRDGKAEHNERSLVELFNIEKRELRVIIRSLMDLGFLEQIGESYKVPILYRDGLSITQGKAF